MILNFFWSEGTSRRGFREMSLARNHGPFVSPKRRLGFSKGTRRRRVIENRKREKKRKGQRQTMKRKGQKEFRNRASPLKSRYPNKYEDNDNDDACCARNRLELIQFPFLFVCPPFFTFSRSFALFLLLHLFFSPFKSLDSTFFYFVLSSTSNPLSSFSLQ